MANPIAKKNLEEGLTLELRSWTSDIIAPGRKMYALTLVKKSKETMTEAMTFPSQFEKYVNDVPRWYEQINTREDFINMHAEIEHTPKDLLKDLLS